MNSFSRHFLAAFSFALCLLPLQAQTARELIGEDPSRIACQLHCYEVPAFHDTPAPAGYKPFYVSHFGRHGSRYHTSAKAFVPTVTTFRELDQKGLLTDTGRIVMRIIDTLQTLHDDMSGYLTQVGSLEHQGVAERLYERCPRVFRQRGRRDVLAVSSTVVRCNQSMMNFCTALKGKAPALDFHYYTNGRTDEALTRVRHGGRNPIYPPKDDSMEKVDSIRRSRIDPTLFAHRMFTDSAAAAACIKNGNMQSFMGTLISHGVIGQCLDEKVEPIYPYFTEDELFNYWVYRNAATLNAHGFSYENGEVLRRVGKLIVTDILEKADEALSDGSTKAADLRFSHDGGVLPLIFYLGLEGNDHTWRLGEEWEHGWYAFQQIPMCTNVQMIFYKNRKDDVLVKFLHNERETTITRLQPWKGPYYKWADLRPYLQALADADCD
ncbi:MAG: hypothetical protein IJ654_04185 [Bacteroidales bacterium]|nr:hypothetical protein [Bacteroidales bacterium]